MLVSAVRSLSGHVNYRTSLSGESTAKSTRAVENGLVSLWILLIQGGILPNVTPQPLLEYTASTQIIQCLLKYAPYIHPPLKFFSLYSIEL